MAISIEAFRLLALRQSLWLETKGMKKKGKSAYSIVKETYALRGNKQSVFEQFTALLRDWGFPIGNYPQR